MNSFQPNLSENRPNRQQEDYQGRTTRETPITNQSERNQEENTDDSAEDEPFRINETGNGNNDGYLNFIRQQAKQKNLSTSFLRKFDRGVLINQKISDSNTSEEEIGQQKSFNSLLINELNDNASEISLLKVKIMENQSIIKTIQKSRNDQTEKFADLIRINNILAEENKRYKNKYGLSHSYVFHYHNIHIFNRIGSGSSSVVHLVKIKNEPSFPEQYYAVKIYINAVEKMEQRDWEKFNNELTINLLISHPFIVKFFGYSDVSDSDSFPSILFEYVEYGNLYQWIQNSVNKEYYPMIRAKFIMQIAIALLYLHEECRIIHRDLKLTNVLIDREENIKICDFSEAIMCKHSIEQKSNVGTPLYRAPETKDRIYTQKCDVYSFGVMMYCLITNDLSGKINLDDLKTFNVADMFQS